MYFKKYSHMYTSCTCFSFFFWHDKHSKCPLGRWDRRPISAVCIFVWQACAWKIFKGKCLSLLFCMLKTSLNVKLKVCVQLRFLQVSKSSEQVFVADAQESSLLRFDVLMWLLGLSCGCSICTVNSWKLGLFFLHESNEAAEGKVKAASIWTTQLENNWQEKHLPS